MAMNKTYVNKLQECMFYAKVEGDKNKRFFPFLQAEDQNMHKMVIKLQKS